MENPLRRPEISNHSRGPPAGHASRAHASRDPRDPRDPYSRSRPSPLVDDHDLEHQRHQQQQQQRQRRRRRRQPDDDGDADDVDYDDATADEPKSFSLIAKGHLIAMSGEFVGTIMFLFFAFGGTQIANTLTPSDSPSLTQLSYISLSFGLSLAVTAWTFYRISGGLFNPAVTFGLVLGGALPSVRGLFLFPVQIIGAIVAAALVSALFPGPLAVETSLGHGTSIAQGVFIEMFLTAELVLTILFLAAEKTKATFIAPVGIGLALFVAELTGVYFTGGSLNPARSFGPCVVNRGFPTYHWIYWIGPFLGAFLAAGYYQLAKFFNYEVANPGQDASHPEESKHR